MEEDLDEWFQQNYRHLGISQIRVNSPGDYLILKDNEWLIAELEKTTSQFFLHKPEIRDRIQVIICFRKCRHHNPEWNKEIEEKEVVEVEKLVLAEIEMSYVHGRMDTYLDAGDKVVEG
jgi:hypothetical protein